MNVDIGASKQAKQFKQASDNRPAPPGSPTEAAVLLPVASCIGCTLLRLLVLPLQGFANIGASK